MSPASKPPAIRIEDIAAHPQFRRLHTIAGIAFDLRYASTHNFGGRVLYADIDCAWLRTEAALGLEAAANWLAREDRSLRLLVLDALRPQRVQEAIWRDVVGTPAERYFADPERGSIHSFGMAVDVTLQDPSGCELDMGSGFDEMTLASHPALEDQHLVQGRLTPPHVAARQLLRGAMAVGGFAGIATEWWHFDHGDRERVRRDLTRVF